MSDSPFKVPAYTKFKPLKNLYPQCHIHYRGAWKARSIQPIYKYPITILHHPSIAEFICLRNNNYTSLLQKAYQEGSTQQLIYIWSSSSRSSSSSLASSLLH